MSRVGRRLGAWWDSQGTWFSAFSRHGERIELCLFDSSGEETGRHDLERGEAGRWSVHLPGVGPGQRFGYRVYGPWQPAAGHYFNPAKLLVDPYALALTGEPTGHERLRASNLGDDGPDRRDSAPQAARSLVIDTDFDWAEDCPPRTKWSETVIYECHVRGISQRHPDVPEHLRGTYLGLASEPIIEHLRGLGVTAVELLPVQQIAREAALDRRGLSNYFGYNPLGFLAPHDGYAATAGHQVSEFKEMVRRLHSAGLELLIDVVLNHTAEGDPRGPMLSLRGFDNRIYYRLDPNDPSRYEDFTGCGNTLDARQPAVIELILTTLEYWAEEMHVDGFRFDLAPCIARYEAFDAAAPLFERLADHPTLRRVKLIAEPWDLGPDGYQLGRFPPGWREWNDRFRDATRRFWRGDTHSAEPLRQALSGSPEIFGPPRNHLASIDFLTCHDGFTLQDLVSYERKHNEDNGEGNRDGSNENSSSNWGVEGPTEVAPILALRRRVKRGLIATLALARGVPMWLAGDELGRTQGGNNNAYCHDSELTWLDWRLDEDNERLATFVRTALALRRDIDLGEQPVAVSPDGRPLTNASRSRLPLLALWREVTGLLMLMNGSAQARTWRLPAAEAVASVREAWQVRLASFSVGLERIERATVRLPAHSLLVLERRPHRDAN